MTRAEVWDFPATSGAADFGCASTASECGEALPNPERTVVIFISIIAV